MAAQIGTHFTEQECREAVRCALDFFRRTGDFEEIPQRVQGIIEMLAVSDWRGQPRTEKTMHALCDTVIAAVRPWKKDNHGRVARDVVAAS
jgi:hypothetical protein